MLNAKPAIAAVKELKTDLPLMISVTFTQVGNERTLFGLTAEAFWATIAHANPVTVGINCGLGAVEMRARLVELASVAGC